MAWATGTALVDGALSMLGAAYADHLAAMGYDLVLVDRHRQPLNRLANRLTTRHRRAVEVWVVQGIAKTAKRAITARLQQDASVVLVVRVRQRRWERTGKGRDATPDGWPGPRYGGLSLRVTIIAREGDRWPADLG